MAKILQFAREFWPILFVPLGFGIGWYLDKKQDEKLTAFRNKSVLYRRELKPGEEVTWR